MRMTEKNKSNSDLLIMCVVAGIVLFYVLTCIFCGVTANYNSILSFGDVPAQEMFAYLIPTQLIKNFNTTGLTFSLFLTLIGTLVLLSVYMDGRKYKHDMEGIEHGSAQWLININDLKGKKPVEPEAAKKYRKQYMTIGKNGELSNNIMFDNKYGLSMDAKKTRRNLHMLVVGGSGAGKTRFFIKPNILQMNSSFIITDPSGELFRDMSQMLRDNNYDVKVFNTFDINRSMQYNPLAYIKKDEDVTNLITTLIKNTGEAKGDNKYFDDATKLLLSAIMLFLVHYCPKEEHDFAHVMQLVVAADVPEGMSKTPKSDLDKIFDEVEAVDPYGLALKMYKSFKSTSGKSLKSVLSSTATRLTVFNYNSIERLTCADTLSLETIGDEKTALFIITPPTDNGFNFLVALMYSQLFSTLYYHAQFECQYLLTDKDYIARPFKTEEEAQHIKSLLLEQQKDQSKELVSYVENPVTEKYDMIETETNKVLLKELRKETVERFKSDPNQFEVVANGKEKAGCPIHVRMLMDEFANINEIPDFVAVLSTIRKYNVSIVIVLQSLSQLKKLYEKDYEAIIDNCDTFIFLGSKGQETTEYVSKMLGDTTITIKGNGESMGKSRSRSSNFSQQKRELMKPDELAQLPTDEQIVIVRGVYPFRIKKYDLDKHPNFKLCADGNPDKITDINTMFKSLDERIEALEMSNSFNSEEVERKPMNSWGDTEEKYAKERTKSETEQEDSFQFF